jgi:hypothetical protein
VLSHQRQDLVAVLVDERTEPSCGERHDRESMSTSAALLLDRTGADADRGTRGWYRGARRSALVYGVLAGSTSAWNA